jgi:hypothetical protein
MAALEPELSRALCRKPAPPGLEERILSRLSRDRQPLRRQRVWSLAAAATLLVCLFGIYANEKRVDRRNARARQQLIETLSVASREVARAELRALSAVTSARADERSAPDAPSTDDAAQPMHSPGAPPRI